MKLKRRGRNFMIVGGAFLLYFFGNMLINAPEYGGGLPLLLGVPLLLAGFCMWLVGAAKEPG